jgi:hypothetical protein
MARTASAGTGQCANSTSHQFWPKLSRRVGQRQRPVPGLAEAGPLASRRITRGAHERLGRFRERRTVRAACWPIDLTGLAYPAAG